MSAIVIRVSGIDVDTPTSLAIDFDVLPAGGGVVAGSVTVPFTGSADGINAGIIGTAKLVAASHGFPVADGDAVLLISGVTSQGSTPPQSQVARVVMQGSTVDSVFVGSADDGGPADVAAQARASALAAATEGSPQEDALKHAAWIAKAPVNPG